MAELIVERNVRLQMRAEAHNLNAGVLVGEKGLTDAVLKEIGRALDDHGLVKVHVASDDRELREEIYLEVADRLEAARIQQIGKMLVFFRPMSDERRAKLEAEEERRNSLLAAKADPGARGAKRAGAPRGQDAKKSPKKASSGAPKSRKDAKRLALRRSRTTKKSALS